MLQRERSVVRDQLQRYDCQGWGQDRQRLRDGEQLVNGFGYFLLGACICNTDDMCAARFDFLNVA
ncbi:hypothetical protein D3C78_1556530 [compost metagenome]